MHRNRKKCKRKNFFSLRKEQENIDAHSAENVKLYYHFENKS